VDAALKAAGPAAASSAADAAPSSQAGRVAGRAAGRAAGRVAGRVRQVAGVVADLAVAPARREVDGVAGRVAGRGGHRGARRGAGLADAALKAGRLAGWAEAHKSMAPPEAGRRRGSQKGRRSPGLVPSEVEGRVAAMEPSRGALMVVAGLPLPNHLRWSRSGPRHCCMSRWT